MKRSAPTAMDLIPAIRDRWSPRAFSSRLPEKAILKRLFEAARWAPSAFNEQPWRFIVALKNDRREHAKLLSCLAEANGEWALRAPVVAILVAKTTFERNGRDNRHASHDCGMALAQLVIQATWEGLFVHPMAGFSREKARELYSIPEGFEALTALAVGHYGDIEDLSEELKDRELAPRTRRPLEETVFAGAWGTPSPLFDVREEN